MAAVGRNRPSLIWLDPAARKDASDLCGCYRLPLAVPEGKSVLAATWPAGRKLDHVRISMVMRHGPHNLATASLAI